MAKLKTGRHTSALKAARQAERRASHNRGLRKGFRTAMKAVAQTKEKAGAQKLIGTASSMLDKAAKKGVIHWKTAARKKSRMAKAANKLAAAASK